MAEWPFILATGAGVKEAELPARDRKVTFKLDDACEAGFTASGRDEATFGIVEMESDLLVYRDRQCLFRGRFGPSGDDIGDAHDCQFNVVDYRGFLRDCRTTLPGSTLEFTTEAVTDIAWTLVADAQDDEIQAGSALGITRGVDVGTSTSIDQAYETGVYVGDAGGKLGRLSGGFEWEVAPDRNDPEVLEFNTWSPQRGSSSEFVASIQDGTVTKWSRAVDTSKYGTLVRQSGAEDVTPYVATSSDIAIRGRVDRIFGDTTLTDAATVQAAAEGQLGLAERILPAYTGTLTPGVWTPDLLWLGDTNRVIVQSGRIDDDLLLRVMEIAVSVSDDGEEIVNVTWGRPPLLNPFRAERDLAARIRNLERR